MDDKLDPRLYISGWMASIYAGLLWAALSCIAVLVINVAAWVLGGGQQWTGVGIVCYGRNMREIAM